MGKIDDRIKALRAVMAKEKIDMYIVPTADFHNSEYVGEYFKLRAWISGFTGSTGTFVITEKASYLWTDGRYFLQASEQLADSEVQLMKMGEPDVQTIPRFVFAELPFNGKLGFDGRVVNAKDGILFAKLAAAKSAELEIARDLVREVATSMGFDAEMSKEPIFELPLKYTGESRASKLTRIRESMQKKDAEVQLLSTLDDICWTLNFRGNDVEFFPLALCYAIINHENCHLYIDESKIPAELRTNLEADGVVIHPYEDIYTGISTFIANKKVMIDLDEVNFSLYSYTSACARTTISCPNPEGEFKTIKNKVELDNIRVAEIKDSIAHVKFMKWLKDNFDESVDSEYGKEEITELSASDKLDEFRAEQGNFIRPSFDPISAYGKHSAVVHYSSTEESNVPLKKGGLFLTDTGAGFWEGSTDVTRTYAIGEVTKEMKEHFTLVMIGNLRLASAKFRKGCTGVALDILARKAMWDRGLDFNHGTGHGVGYLLNIHEGKPAFRWRVLPNMTPELQEGMIITDEPGLYFDGSHGIRLENEVLVREDFTNEYGTFMKLETLTFIPFDLDAVDASVMNDEDKKLLNDYHKQVYEKLAPSLDEEEREWLKKYTREI